MRITERKYLPEFNAAIGNEINMLVAQFDFAAYDDIEYQMQASAVYSSNIEGNSIDLNSFMNRRLSKNSYKPQKEDKAIEDLYAAYTFAETETLTEKNLLKAHKLLSKQLVTASLRGKYRNDKVGVFGQSRLIYLAIEAEFVPK